jgi:heme A synthase
MQTRSNSFARYSWFLIGYNLLVILWGAYVRASGSGAGCGAHWPLCNGQVIPSIAQMATQIEFIHRLMSGATLLLSLALFVWAWRAFPRGTGQRLGAALVLAFTLSEALVGAALVLFSWVGMNASVGRAISVAVHLVNTLLLLASLTLTAWWASGGRRTLWRTAKGSAWVFYLLATSGILLLSATGAVTALGDTLFPSASLAQGISQDFIPTANFLIRLRIIHPLIAAANALLLAVILAWTFRRQPTRLVRRFGLALAGLFTLQIGLGLLNVMLMAPTWLQLIHLLVADLIWIDLVLLFSTAVEDWQNNPALQPA